MSYRQMVLDLAKPGAAIIESFSKSPELAHLAHMVGCSMEETGELADAFFNRKTEHVLEELGDKRFYIEGGYTYLSLATPSYAPVGGLTGPVVTRLLLQQLILEAAIWGLTKRPSLLGKYPKGDDGQPVTKEVFDAKLKVALDAAWVNLCRLADAFGLTMEEIEEANMQKLLKGDCARYKSGKYSDEQCNSRVDKIGTEEAAH